ncbi:hypothetical protein M0R04_02230 [Candidatus Dojkabacteria bacterium]|jgi:hypothetical protein|nr:hypothetical protein [Candidatus Dojkabacteria bacterium]
MKTFLKIFSLLVLGGAILFGWVTWLNTKIERENIKSEVKSVSDYSGYPTILNIAPTNAYVNERYSYILKIADEDTPLDNLHVELSQSPDWLSINGLEIYGTPSYLDMKTTKVILKITDGTHVILDNFYILVQERNETN